MKLSRKARSLRSSIEEACQCSYDDPGMARYFGVPLYEVGAIRLAMTERLEAAKRTEEELASADLRDAIHGLFRKWERDHGFQKGAGQILLPAGYNPERQMEAA